MAFKMIKGFAARQAAVHTFAGRGAKLAHQTGMVGMAVRALHDLLGKQSLVAKLLLRIGWCNAVGFKFLPAAFRHPVRCPGR